MARLIVEYITPTRDPMKNQNLESSDATSAVIEDSGTTSTDAPEGTTAVTVYADGAAFWYQIAASPVATTEGEDCHFIADGERRFHDCGSGMSVDAAADA